MEYTAEWDGTQHKADISSVPGKGTSFTAYEASIFHQLFFSCHSFIDNLCVKTFKLFFFSYIGTMKIGI